jgi:hypothetical protein
VPAGRTNGRRASRIILFGLNQVDVKKFFPTSVNFVCGPGSGGMEIDSDYTDEDPICPRYLSRVEVTNLVISFSRNLAWRGLG